MITTDPGSVVRLVESLESELPGVLHDVVRKAVWDTVDDFCARTGYFRKVVSFTPVANTPRTLTSLDGVIQQIVEVYGLQQYRVEQPDTIISASAEAATALVTLRPTDLDATPADIVSAWYMVLRHGSLARLLAEPFKPYTNLEVAAQYIQLFELGLARANAEAPQIVGAVAVDTTNVIDRIYTNVAAVIPLAVHTQVQVMTWNAIEVFFERSQYYRRVVNWTLTGGTATVAPPSGFVVKQILEVYGISRYRIEQPNRIIALEPGTPAGQALAVLSPTSLATTPMDVVQTWFDVILSGTLLYLFAEPGRPYSSPELVQLYTASFAAGIVRAMSQAQEVVSPAASQVDTQLDRIYAGVFAQIPAIAHTQVQMAVWNSVEDFLARSGYWRKTVDWVITANDTSIRLTSPDGSIQETVEVYGINQYRVEQPDIIIPLEPMSATGTALITLTPNSLDTTPETILTTWFDAILYGALARLFLEPARSYTSAELSTAYGAMFERSIVMARAQKPEVVSPSALKPDNIDRLYSNIYAELPEVPHTQVQLMAWNAIEQFYTESAVRREHVFWQMPPGISYVDFNPFDGDWDVAWILDFYGLPSSGRVDPPSILRDLRHPVPQACRNGGAWLGLKPIDFNSDVGSMAWSQWFKYIQAGTLYCLYSQPGKAYTSPQLAVFYGKRFRSGIAHARSFALAHNSNKPSWGFPYYSDGRRKS